MRQEEAAWQSSLQNGAYSILTSKTQLTLPSFLSNRAMVFTKSEYFEWAYSDLLSNRNRGIIAEFLVGRALDCHSSHRIEWDACDLTTKSGHKIEVKASGYLQSWPQSKPSQLKFDISEKKGWDSATNISALESSRSADIYVFCIFESLDAEHANPLDASQWSFVVIPTRVLNERLPGQKSALISTLDKLANRIRYDDLRAAVESGFGC